MIQKSIDIWEGFDFLSESTVNPRPMLRTYVLSGEKVRGIEMISLEKQVSPATPPTFIWHTSEDELVPVENSMLFASALSRHKVPFGLHIYPQGNHGQALGTKETANEKYKVNSHVATWLGLSVQWLQLTFNESEI